MTDPTTPKLRVLKPPSERNGLGLAELWQSRDLVRMLAKRDFTLRYRQTLLGVVWVLLGPLLGAGIFSVVFGSIADLDSDGVPYFAFTLVGMGGWTLFSSTINRMTPSVVSNSPMVSKVYVPRLSLPVGASIATLVDLVVISVVVAAVVGTSSVDVHTALVLAPVWLAMLFLQAIGIGLVTAAMMVRFRDLQPIVTMSIQFLLFVSPIAYSSSAVPDRFRWMYDVNPLVGLIDGLRWSVLGTPLPDTGRLIYSVIASVVFPWIGLVVFRRKEPAFADVI